MSPEASAIKKTTLERYEYCVEDRVKGYSELLDIANKQPDEYWEEQACAQGRRRSSEKG